MSINQPTREIPWADTADAGDIAEPSDGNKGSGWTGTPAPPYQWFNWILRQAARWIKYLRARGIPDYDTAESYSIGDRVQSSGLTYTCSATNGPGAPKHPYDGTGIGFWDRWGYTTGELDSWVDVKRPNSNVDASSLVSTQAQVTIGGARLSTVGDDRTLVFTITGLTSTSPGSATFALSGEANFDRWYFAGKLSSTNSANNGPADVTNGNASVSVSWPSVSQGSDGYVCVFVYGKKAAS